MVNMTREVVREMSGSRNPGIQESRNPGVQESKKRGNRSIQDELEACVLSFWIMSRIL
jgi:hypothetical protein